MPLSPGRLNAKLPTRGRGYDGFSELLFCCRVIFIGVDCCVYNMEIFHRIGKMRPEYSFSIQTESFVLHDVFDRKILNNGPVMWVIFPKIVHGYDEFSKIFQRQWRLKNRLWIFEKNFTNVALCLSFKTFCRKLKFLLNHVKIWSKYLPRKS